MNLPLGVISNPPTIEEIKKVLKNAPNNYSYGLVISHHDFTAIVDANPGIESISDAIGVKRIIIQSGPWHLVRIED